MRLPDDDYDGMNELDDVGAGFERPGGPVTEDASAVTRFLAELHSLGEGPVPAPTPELQAMFDGASSAPPRRPRRPRAPLVRRAALVAAAAVIGTTTAAANHTLPQPAQRVVSDVVNTLTPFHINGGDGLPPRPAPAVPPAHRPPSNDGSGDGRPAGSNGESHDLGDGPGGERGDAEGAGD